VLINQSPGLDLNNKPAAGNLVGGVNPAARNVISGNVAGVTLFGGDSRGNIVIGNLIGPGPGGQTAVGNSVGVFLNGAPGNQIGAAAATVISGNMTVAVSLLGTATTGNRVVGNIIGLNVGGTKPLPNQYGVYAENAPTNTVGGTTVAERNVISANAIAGVYI